MKINTFQKENSNKAPKKTICRVQCYLTSKDTLVGKRTPSAQILASNTTPRKGNKSLENG